MDKLESWLSIIGAILAALYSYFKWGIETKNIFQTVKGQNRIQTILDDLVKYEKNIEIASIAETTNGGGVPTLGNPLYIRTLYSSDAETLKLFGGKYLVGGENLYLTLMRSVVKDF